MAVSDGDDSGLELGYAQAAFDAAGWLAVELPGAFERVASGLDCYSGKVWYRRSIEIPADWQDGHVVLCFEGANYHTLVWVNGQPVGGNQTGFLPFELAVHGALRHGQANQITVCVDAFARPTENPGTAIGWRNFGGILRRLYLERRNPAHLIAVRTTARPTGTGGELTVEVDIGQAVRGRVVAVLHERGDQILCQWETPTDGLSVLRLATAHVSGVRAWSPDDPAIYRLSVSLVDASGQLDTRQLQIGFRTIQACDGQLLLNDAPIYLTGFNRHEDSASADMASDLRTTEQDLRQMKLAGANFVRLCHYPHDSRELDLCDRLGLLVMDEIPVYWLSVMAGKEGDCATKASQAADQLARMIARDRNHPSVIFWSVSNETHEQHEPVWRANDQLIQQARSLDPTRLVTHVSDKWHTYPDHFALDDVICVNGYPNVWPWTKLPQAPDAAQTIWRDSLAHLHQRYPSKPILVSEFGHPGIDGENASRWGLDRQAQVLAAEFAAFDAPYVCGTTVWCWADHAWPAREFMNGLSVSPFGVVNRNRQPKPALSAIARLFRQKHNLPDDRPMSRPVGPADVIMVCHRMGVIADAPLPDGYSFQPITPQNAALWTDIWRDADASMDVDDGLFNREFGSDWSLIGHRCWLVCDRRNRAVATISAWLDHRPGQSDSGRIHWVAVRPAWQGRGLARPMMSQAMRLLAAHHDEVHLCTQADRIPAIALYLRYGFVPSISDAHSRQLWAHVSTRLSDPAIETALDRYNPPSPT